MAAHHQLAIRPGGEVRRREDEGASHAQDAGQLGEHAGHGVRRQVLDDLGEDDGVEGAVGEGQSPLDVGGDEGGTVHTQRGLVLARPHVAPPGVLHTHQPREGQRAVQRRREREVPGADLEHAPRRVAPVQQRERVGNAPRLVAQQRLAPMGGEAVGGARIPAARHVGEQRGDGGLAQRAVVAHTGFSAIRAQPTASLTPGRAP